MHTAAISRLLGKGEGKDALLGMLEETAVPRQRLPARTFFGKPLGLAYLAFAEAWERFSYYGMTALLVRARRYSFPAMSGTSRASPRSALRSKRCSER